MLAIILVRVAIVKGSIKFGWDTVNAKNVFILWAVLLVGITLFSGNSISLIPKVVGMILYYAPLWIVVGGILGCFLGLIIAFLVDDTEIPLPDGHYKFFSIKLALLGAISAPFCAAAVLITI